MHIMLNLL